MLKRALAALAVIGILAALSGCGARIENRVFGERDLEGRRVGVISGTASESYMFSRGGDITVVSYVSAKDAAKALRSGEVDCVVCGGDDARSVRRGAAGLRTLDEPLHAGGCCLAVSADNPELFEKLSGALESLRSLGTVDAIVRGGQNGRLPSGVDPSGGQPVSVAVAENYPPYSYYDEDGTLTGIEIRIVDAVCKRIGLTPEYDPVDLDLVLYMAESGKVAFAAARVAGDEGGAVLLTDPYDEDIDYIVVRK